MIAIFTVIGMLALAPLELSSAFELAPDFALDDIEGQQFWLHDFSGKAVVLM